jgi:hypothetical protein
VWAERVVAVAGPLVDLAASVSFCLPGIPGTFQLKGRGHRQVVAGAELAKVQVVLGGSAPLLNATVRTHRGDVELLDPPGAGQLVDIGGDPLQDRLDPGQVGYHRGGVGPVTGVVPHDPRPMHLALPARRRIAERLFLTMPDLAPLLVLLVAVTGRNIETIKELPAEHRILEGRAVELAPSSARAANN